VRHLARDIWAYGSGRLATPDERVLAGRISGALWLSGAVTLLVSLAMPGERIEHAWVVVVAAAFAVA
jgi:hypothetical protein